MVGVSGSELRTVRTERLRLRAVTGADVDSLHSDPRVWRHLPSGVHTERRQTQEQVARWQGAWERWGLGYWTVWLDDGAFAGIGGCTVNRCLAWNLHYRLEPETHGHGYATELALAARSAASSRRPELPVTALLLEHNVPSRIVAERCGLRPVWRGPDEGNPDATAIRLVYADRRLSGALIASLLARG